MCNAYTKFIVITYEFPGSLEYSLYRVFTVFELVQNQNPKKLEFYPVKGATGENVGFGRWLGNEHP